MYFFLLVLALLSAIAELFVGPLMLLLLCLDLLQDVAALDYALLGLVVHEGCYLDNGPLLLIRLLVLSVHLVWICFLNAFHKICDREHSIVL